MSNKQLEATEEAWRECLLAYQRLKEAHETFRMAALEVHPDHAGPGLKRALRLSFHKRRFNMFLEDLIYEDMRSGGVSELQVPPRKSSGGKKKDKDEVDLFDQ